MGARMFQLKGKYPNTHYILVRHERYAEISKQVMDLLRDFIPKRKCY